MPSQLLQMVRYSCWQQECWASPATMTSSGGSRNLLRGGNLIRNSVLLLGLLIGWSIWCHCPGLNGRNWYSRRLLCGGRFYAAKIDAIFWIHNLTMSERGPEMFCKLPRRFLRSPEESCWSSAVRELEEEQERETQKRTCMFLFLLGSLCQFKSKILCWVLYISLLTALFSNIHL